MIFKKVSLCVALAAFCIAPASARPHGGAASAAPSGLSVPLTIANTSGSTITSTPVTLTQPLATGDLPTGNHLVVYSGSTPLTTQEDPCSQWVQDGSCKATTVSFIAPSIAGSSTAAYTIQSASGAPSTTPNVTISNITTNTHFYLESTDLREMGGTVETGTWEFIDLNYVVNNCQEYNGSTGYGSNPICGWEYTSQGPIKTGIHAFQYARRSSDNAVQKWIRSDMYIDFFGSGATPCPCSVTVLPNQPNTFGAVSGGTVGASTETGHVFNYTLYNGSNVLNAVGTANDSRTQTLSPSAFTNSYNIALGSWVASVNGTYPTIITPISSSTLPNGIVNGQIYWIAGRSSPTALAYTQSSTIGYNEPGGTATTTSQVYSDIGAGYVAQYMYFSNNGSNTIYLTFCPTSSCTATTGGTPIAANSAQLIGVGTNAYWAYITATGTSAWGADIVQGFSDTGSGTFNAAFYAFTNSHTGTMVADSNANRIWVSAAGTVTVSPPTLVGHDLTYLGQKTKAILPLITAVAGTLPAYSASDSGYFIDNYYPGSFDISTGGANNIAWDIDTSGDTLTDGRIGYLTQTEIYSLLQPQDEDAANMSNIIAAGFARMNFWNIDEKCGMPLALNDGHTKTGTPYTSSCTVQPNARLFSYLTGCSPSCMSFNQDVYNLDAIQNRYDNGSFMDPSHMPSPQQVPLLKTGNPEWLYMMAMEADGIIGIAPLPVLTPSSVNYYRVCQGYSYSFGGQNQIRGGAWCERALFQANYFMPSSSGMYQYFNDLTQDNINFFPDWTTNQASPYEAALGFWAGDTDQINGFSSWEDDFWFMTHGMEAWRNEYPGALSFTKNYMAKYVVGRGDSSATIPGCLWSAPAHVSAPYGTRYSFNGSPVDEQYLPQTFSDLYNNNAAQTDAMGGGYDVTPPYAPSIPAFCPTGGFIADQVGGTIPGGPTGGNVTQYAGSTAIGSLIGVPDSASLYSAIRTIQYAGTCPTCGGTVLSFSHYLSSGGYVASPGWAFGPLGATNFLPDNPDFSDPSAAANDNWAWKTLLRTHP